MLHMESGWRTQNQDPYLLLTEIGAAAVAQRESEGDMEAQYTLGESLLARAVEYVPGMREAGVAALEKAAAQGHAHAMLALARVHNTAGAAPEFIEWATKASDTGLPSATYALGLAGLECAFRAKHAGTPVSNSEYAEPMRLIRLAANRGHAGAALSMHSSYAGGFNGVSRARHVAMAWLRKAAETGHLGACIMLASNIYLDRAYARDVGEIADPSNANEDYLGYYIQLHHLRKVLYWLRKGVCDEGFVRMFVNAFDSELADGSSYCMNRGCEVVRHLKHFQVCGACKMHRYCSKACQAADWRSGHAKTCGACHGLEI